MLVGDAPKTRSRRSSPALLPIAALVVLLYVAGTFGQVWLTASTDRARPADAILVLGAAQYDGRPSPVFAARLDHAADLYARGMAGVVVVTGGRQPGDTYSEANVADAYLQQRGVPASALRLEVDGTTSYLSLAASARFLAREGVTEVILVSDGWHLARSAEIARSVGLQPHTSPAPSVLWSSAAQLKLMARETVGLAVGRLIGFRRLDHMATSLAST